jgi:serine/threonine protein kinase/tetratricopeptide (TPR) repeat protein
MSEASADDPLARLSAVARLDDVCDRFEAAWQAGQRPRLEDYLADTPKSDHSALVRELVHVEVFHRRRLGETPQLEEYRARFPDADVTWLAPAPAHPEVDRGLLFGLLAVQLSFIRRDTLIGAMQAWVLDKAKPLGQILVEQGALPPARRDLVEALVQEHLALHGHDSARSLAAVGAPGSLRQHLEQIIDADLRAGLAQVAAARPDDEDSWPTRYPAAWSGQAAGTPTSTERRFRILRLHRKGGLGQVSVALDEELDREVAFKEIQAKYADDPQSRARFLLEAQITGGLEHPGIVPVYGLGVDAGGRPFYAMRFIKGDSLQKAITRFHQPEAPDRDPGEPALTLRQLLGRFVAVCQAVAYAHSRGVLHRDLKPDNIMLGPFGETLVVDWGLAKLMGRVPEGLPGEERPLEPAAAAGAAPTHAGDKMGTRGYMSPEQAAGQLDRLGPASDVYSLGATLYCLLTGTSPAVGPDDQAIRPTAVRGAFPARRHVKRGVAPALEAICRKAMALKPEDRYASTRELADDVEHWLADEPVSAWPEPWPVKARRWLNRHRTLVTTTAASVVVAVVGLTIATIFLTAANESERQARHQAELAKQAAEKAEQVARQRLADSYYAAARLAMGRGAWREAKNNIDAALEAGYRHSANVHLDRIRALCALHQVPDAEKELQALSQRSDLERLDGRVLLWQADLALNRSAQNPTVRPKVQQALEKTLPPAEEAYARGLLAQTTPEAVRCFRDAVRLDPFHPRANAMLAYLLVLIGHRQEARERILVAELLFPDDPTFRVIHAVLEALEDNLPAAKEHLDKARTQVGDKAMRTASALVYLYQFLSQIVKEIDEGSMTPRSPRLVDLAQRMSSLLADEKDPGGELFLTTSPIFIEAVMPELPELLTAFLVGLNVDRAIDKLGHIAEIHPDGLVYITRGILLARQGTQESWMKAEKDFLQASEAPSVVLIRRLALRLAAHAEHELARSYGLPEKRSQAAQNLREIMRSGRLRPGSADLLSDLAIGVGDMDLARWIISEWEQQAGRTHRIAQAIAIQGLAVRSGAAPVVPQTAVALRVAAFDPSALEQQAPGDPKRREQRARAEFFAGAYGPAIELMDQIVKQDPKAAARWRDYRTRAVAALQKQAKAVSPPKESPPE